jgi:hypothetical protein
MDDGGPACLRREPGQKPALLRHGALEPAHFRLSSGHAVIRFPPENNSRSQAKPFIANPAIRRQNIAKRTGLAGQWRLEAL